MNLNHCSGLLERAGSSGCPSGEGDATSHVPETSSGRSLLADSQRHADYGVGTLGNPCCTIDPSGGTGVGLNRCSLLMVLLAIFAIMPLPSHAQETLRVSVKEGGSATTTVPSGDESIPGYTVRARLHREGGLPVNWLAKTLAQRLRNIGGARGGAVIGRLLGGPAGVIAEGATGWLGGKIGAYLGEELVGDGRCGVDIDVEAPSSSSSLQGDWAYGGIWMVDIPFDFSGLFKPASSTLLSGAEAMPTTGPWDSREYVRAGSTLAITADDSLCYRASLDAEFEYEYDCDLYCNSTDPDAVCPARCLASEMEFVRIPAGSFQMGSPALSIDRGLTIDEVRTLLLFEPGMLNLPDPDEFPQHSRSVAQFSLGKYEVTQAQWEAVMGSPPRCFVEGCAACPVTCVSWDDTQEFIGKLNEQESESRYSYRLPTEAEWEYAARAGTTGWRYGKLDEIAWYSDNSGGRRHPVGEKRANAWGLHDMLGNVREWTADGYRPYPGADYVLNGSRGILTPRHGVFTPHLADYVFDGSVRVARGGGWGNGAWYVRSAARTAFSPGGRSSGIGFRLVRTD